MDNDPFINNAAEATQEVIASIQQFLLVAATPGSGAFFLYRVAHLQKTLAKLMEIICREASRSCES